MEVFNESWELAKLLTSSQVWLLVCNLTNIPKKHCLFCTNLEKKNGLKICTLDYELVELEVGEELCDME